ncbi:unnamed protein product [Rotaria sp. Silwood1]|nr:unnamed protein product [Rotaria sp. Silwood1]CAF3457404.1 unnamed protein product [Rotaria sp. Silwood1]CAF3498201.1 unnamed protein product [Rotaria sp. Silwood1]CAF3530242.1 unnamed protein product [Rotaria sp. Silwood1]CAF4627576.1 unnamed protein product [Rotaria sp. Silwood1]
MENETEKLLGEPPKYDLCLALGLIGILLASIPLTSVLTLYISQQSTTTTASTTITVATNKAYYCGGLSSYTLWQLFSTTGIYMNIDTTICGFSSTPLYFTSMAGNTIHWELASYTAIYSPTNISFTIYVRSLSGLNNTDMLSYSQAYLWNVNWFGVSY